MTIHIKIGEIETLDSSDWAVVPDDRQTRIETIGGIEIQDFGRVPEADVYTCKATLVAEAAAEVADYWHNRTRVTVRDTAGNEHENLRVIVKKYNYVEHFENFDNLGKREQYYAVEFEFWRK